MKYPALCIALAVCLSGCDAANDLATRVGKVAQPNVGTHEPMTLVIKSGYKVIVGGRPASIFGRDTCPPSNTKFMTALFGPSADDGTSSCVVIAPDTKTVVVTVGTPDGTTDEVWTVERSGDRTMLRRADGSPIAAAN